MCVGALLVCVGMVMWVVWPSPVQGSWTVSGGDAEFAWYTTTSMRMHWYAVDGYPPIHTRGIYWVSGEHGEGMYTVRVLVFPQDGSLWKVETHIVTVHDDGSLTLDHAATQ